MESISPSSNQNQSLVKKKLDKALTAYTSYLSTKGYVLEVVSKHIPEALPSLEKIIKKLDEFGECKSFLTNDQETLQRCIDEYNFKYGLLKGIWEYTIWKHTPEQIKEFTKGLEALAKGGKRVIKVLYKQYQQYKTTPIPQEDIDPRVLNIVPEVRAIKSLILRYLENPESYGKQISKYLEKELLEVRVEERKEVKAYEELREAIKEYALYLSSTRFALEVVSKHIPEALPSLEKIIKNLEEWNGYRSFLTIDQEALKEYTDKYYFMYYFMSSIPEWWLSRQEHTPKEIEGFIEGMETLAGKGKEIIDDLYRLYKGVKRLALEHISKGYQTIPTYKLEEARASAAGTIRKLLVNYFSILGIL
ncbi:MAG: hypothetical protein ACO2OX_03670 [Candidatus Nanopusillus sp.]